MINSYVTESVRKLNREPVDIMYRVSSCRPGALFSVPIAYNFAFDKWATCEGVWNTLSEYKFSTYREEVYTETDFGDTWRLGPIKKQRYALRRVLSPFDPRTTLRWLQNIDKAELWVQTILFIGLMVPVPDDLLGPIASRARTAQEHLAEWMRDTASINKTIALSDEAVIGPLEHWALGIRLSYYQAHSRSERLMKQNFGQSELQATVRGAMPAICDIVPFP